MNLSLKASDVLKLFPDAEISGSLKSEEINGIANLRDAIVGDLSFLGNARYKSQVKDCKASVVLLPNNYTDEPSEGQLFIKLENPSLALAQICRILESKLYPAVQPGIHSTAFVETSAEVDESVSIEAFSYVGKLGKIGKNCKISTHCHVGSSTIIGDDSILHPGVKLLSRCKIGKGVILNAGVVIGSEGYGFDQSSGSHQKIPHLGTVVIEDGVEIVQIHVSTGHALKRQKLEKVASSIT